MLNSIKKGIMFSIVSYKTIYLQHQSFKSNQINHEIKINFNLLYRNFVFDAGTNFGQTGNPRKFWNDIWKNNRQKNKRTLTVCQYCNKGKQQSGNWWHHI